MTESRRRAWRAENRPPVRRSDPVWDLVGWAIPSLAFVAIVSASGLSCRSPQLPVEASAAFLSLDASILLVLIGAVVIRRWQGITPARYSWAVFAWAASATITAAIILWARGSGGSIGVILLPLVLCGAVTMLCIVLVVSRFWLLGGAVRESSG